VSIGCAAAYQEAAKEKGNAAFHHEFLHMIMPGIGTIARLIGLQFVQFAAISPVQASLCQFAVLAFGEPASSRGMR
jgi:hypothetical protein